MAQGSLRYVLGLDIGIKSVGWAVIRYGNDPRIEDFGVRMFDTTENPQSKNNANQDRRGYRARRRVVRRKSHRKARLKTHLQRIGLLQQGQVEAFFETGHADLLSLRVKGLTEQLTPAELAACLIHFSNHRGYQNFYSLEEEDRKQLSAQEKKEYEKENQGIERVNAIMKEQGYRSVAEMLLKDETFAPKSGSVRVYRSHPYNDVRYPISRDLLRKEADAILQCQSKFYPCLNQPYNTAAQHSNRGFLLNVIFEQRDFEDGPGDAQDPMRKYTGFLDAIGTCQYYRQQPRGARMTVLGDLFAVTNTLSQYRYINKTTGEFGLPKEMAQELVQATLNNAELPKKEISAIAKKYNIEIDDKTVKSADRAPNCVKFLKRVKPILEECGVDWQQALGEDALSYTTMLNQIGRVLSLYQTPRRRKKELLAIEGMTEQLAARLTAQKLSGTAKVCDAYMKDAIEAFCNGERYGEFQWRIANELERPQVGKASGTHTKLPPFSKDEEFAKNSVVMRSLNETRKVINAIVGKYGSPWAVNIEVASDLGRSWAERNEIDNQQKKNQKRTEAEKKEICQILNLSSEEDVTSAMLERYRLAEQQGWKCLYTDTPFSDKRAVLTSHNRQVEVDHIVPFSLVLDNTLQNKALVLADANQTKGQRTPLMYLKEEQKQAFIGRVNQLAKEEKISEQKRRYLLLDTLSNADLLSEWKSRNLNDTRYIAKYLRGYLEQTLQPAQEHRKPFVFPVKGGLTSRFRRVWLNKTTWGTDEKDKLRQQTTLHHAVDAVVIANIAPATAQIAEDNMRLNRILKASKGLETQEYRAMLERSVQTLQQFYGIPKQKAEQYLTRKNRITALIERLNDEVDARFGAPLEEVDPTEYTQRALRHYQNDADFAKQLTPPLTSRKQERKLQGQVTTDTLIKAKEIDGVWYELKRKDVLTLTYADLNKLYTNDGDLRDSLFALFADVTPDQAAALIKEDGENEEAQEETTEQQKKGKKKAEQKTVLTYLQEQGKNEFYTQKGRLIRKVTLIVKPLDWDVRKKKDIAPTNYSVLETNKYYCIEVYRTTTGETKLRGICRSDILCQNKKMYLAKPLPQDYQEHLTYLFKNDYITVGTEKGEMKFEGFYQSAGGVTQGILRGIRKNESEAMKFRFPKKAIVKKYAVDILGRKGGEIKCGELLLLPAEKN